MTRLILTLFLFILFSNSCLKLEIQKNTQFPQSFDTLIEQYGAPLFREDSQYTPGREILHYQGGISYEVDDSVVYSKYVNPVGLESEIDYWESKFRPYQTNLREISGEVTRNGTPFRQIVKCHELKVQVVYEPALNKVTKIIYLNE